MKYSITIGLEPLDGIHDHPTRMVSTFDLERNSFPVTVESCQGAEGREDDTLFLSMTPSLRQIMLMLMMTYAYLDNNNNGDLHRELLLPCLLCMMKNCVRKMNRAWVTLGKFLREFVYLAVEICHQWTLLSATPSFQVRKTLKIGKKIKDAVVLGWGRKILENSSETIGIIAVTVSALS